MVRTPAPSGWTASHPAQAHRARPKRRRAIGSEAGAPRRIVLRHSLLVPGRPGRAPSAGRGRPQPQRRRTPRRLPPAGWPPRQRQRPGPQRRPGCFRQPSGDSASGGPPATASGQNWSGRGDLSEEGPLRLDSTTLTIRVNCRVRHPRPCTSAAPAVLASVHAHWHFKVCMVQVPSVSLLVVAVAGLGA